MARLLSNTLRNGSDDLTFDHFGRVKLDTLVEFMITFVKERSNENVTVLFDKMMNFVQNDVLNNDKDRFCIEVVDGVTMISACQGHSTEFVGKWSINYTPYFYRRIYCTIRNMYTWNL